jgi:hypothetical protein
LKTFVAMLTCLGVVVVSVAALLYLPSWDSPDSAATVPKIKPGTSLLAQSGATSATTDSFSVASRWNLIWRYDCSNTPFGVGDFAVHLYNGTSTNKQIDYVNRDVHRSGNAGAGIEHYSAGDSHRKVLVVETPCRWGVIVQGA